jgi:hypothetical protein
MTVTIAALVLRLARTTAAAVDVPAMLTDVCRTTRSVLGVRAVLAAAGRTTATGPTALGGSDETADRLARLQREARGGPLAAVLRSGRPLHTADLTRIGPPELAAAAAEAGLTTSFTVPLVAGGEPVGALQLLGEPGRPVGPELLEPVAAVLDVLAARLADVDERRRLADAAAGTPPDNRTEETTAVIRIAPPVRRAPVVEPPTQRMAATPNAPRPGVPAPRPSPAPHQSDVEVPVPRHPESGSSDETPEPAVNGSAPGRRSRHGRDDPR